MDFLKAYRLEATPLSYDAVIEGDTRAPSAQFAHYETSRCCARHVEAMTVALGSQENVVVGCGVNRLEEFRLKRDVRDTCLQLPCAEILEPVLRALHGVERYLAPIRQLYPSRLLPGNGNVAGDVEVAARVNAEDLCEAGTGIAPKMSPCPGTLTNWPDTPHGASASIRAFHPNSTVGGGRKPVRTPYRYPVLSTGGCPEHPDRTSGGGVGDAGHRGASGAGIVNSGHAGPGCGVRGARDTHSATR